MPEDLFLAHPLTEAGRLPVPPLAVAFVAVAVVGIAAIIGSAAPAGRASSDAAWYRQAPSRWSLVGRGVALAIVLLGILAGRVGTDRVTANIAPALLLGASLPLLVLTSAAIGRVWERIDPWDGAARLLGRWTSDSGDDADKSPAPVSWALPLAVAFGWYISTYRQALVPSRVALAAAGYLVVTLAGCLAAGRVAWLTRAEPVGILLRAVGRLRRGRLAGWVVPPAMGVVLGVLGGSFLFAALRTSELWLPLTFRLGRASADLIGFAACAGGGGALLWAAERVARRGGYAGTPTASAVPVIGALCLAAAMTGGQVVIAVQLLPALLSDPLGRGWNLFGTAGWQPNPNPLGDAGHTATQVLILIAGGVAGVRVARRRAAGRAASTGGLAPAAAATALLVAGVLAVTTV